MRKPELQAQIEAATAYETLMVPALFGEWAGRAGDAPSTGVRALATPLSFAGRRAEGMRDLRSSRI